MHCFDSVLFDLDGTLVDSSEGITKSVSHALQKRGYGTYAPESLKSFIGPPLRESFMAFCGVDTDEGTALVEAYREYYAKTGIFECSVYPGIREMLSALRKAGKPLFVATSKPEAFARRVLGHFALTGSFVFIGGARMDNTRTDKCEVIQYTLENVPKDITVRNPVMVGDSPHDILGARKAGLPGIAVSYGFGDPTSLENAKPCAVCNTAQELTEYLLR